MKISRFAFFFKENDLSLAYCSRTNALFEITDDLLSFFVENKQKEEIDISFFDKQTSDFLIEQKIIISPNEDQLYIRELLFKTQQIAFSNEHLSLIISQLHNVISAASIASNQTRTIKPCQRKL